MSEDTDLQNQVHQLAEQVLGQTLTLRAGTETIQTTYKEAGFAVDEALLLRQMSEAKANQGTHSSFFLHLPVQIDETKGENFLKILKQKIDQTPIDEVIDLNKKEIIPGLPGHALDVTSSMVPLQYEARNLSSGKAPQVVSLFVFELAAKKSSLKNEDIAEVIARYETKYSPDKDRTYNLKLAADKIDGLILYPGQIFSFNGTVGYRTEAEGYRVAPVISAGELVDGLAGGMCQLASTLHAAAFFGGLDIKETLNHSRPLAYIKPGLDSTVVYEKNQKQRTDLKIKNNFDFPILIHYMVNQNYVKVEILAKKRPYHVIFEREVLNRMDYSTEIREDPTMPMTQEPLLDQEGHRGYLLKRRRYLFTGPIPEIKNGKIEWTDQNQVIEKRSWDVRYEPTKEIQRVGTGPAGLKPRPKPSPHHVPEIPGDEYPLFHIVK